MVGRIEKALWLEGKACRLAIEATATGDERTHFSWLPV
jgi:hypothetical protein